jgi:hypothetical protein
MEALQLVLLLAVAATIMPLHKLALLAKLWAQGPGRLLQTSHPLLLLEVVGLGMTAVLVDRGLLLVAVVPEVMRPLLQALPRLLVMVALVFLIQLLLQTLVNQVRLVA